jgi:hypothetical protein
MDTDVTRFLEQLFSDKGIMYATTGSMEFTPGRDFGPQTKQILSFMETGKHKKPLEYNGFHGDAAATFLRNHLGKEIIGMDFGREYSPVLYLRLRLDGDSNPYPEYAVDEKKLAKILSKLKKLGADELSVEESQHIPCHDGKVGGPEGTKMVIRAWWD